MLLSNDHLQLCETFFHLAFQTPIIILLAITSWCQNQVLTLTDWVDFETVDSWRSCLCLLDWILLCCENLLDTWYWRIELLHWILKTPLLNLVRFHVFKHHLWKLLACLVNLLCYLLVNIICKPLLWMIWSQFTCFTLLCWSRLCW